MGAGLPGHGKNITGFGAIWDLLDLFFLLDASVRIDAIIYHLPNGHTIVVQMKKSIFPTRH